MKFFFFFIVHYRFPVNGREKAALVTVRIDKQPLSGKYCQPSSRSSRDLGPLKPTSGYCPWHSWTQAAIHKNVIHLRATYRRYLEAGTNLMPRKVRTHRGLFKARGHFSPASSEHSSWNVLEKCRWLNPCHPVVPLHVVTCHNANTQLANTEKGFYCINNSADAV